MPLIDLLPPYYRGSEETLDLQNALNNQVLQVQTAKNNVFLQLNVETATWGLDLWEKALGLETDVSKSYDYRRSRINSKMRAQGTTTVAMIKNVAESFSNGAVDIIEHNSEYRFDVKFTGTIGLPPNMDDLTAAIEEIKPAHLAYTYVFIYITWNNVEKYNHTWDVWDTRNLTWDEFEAYKE